ncbi:MAG TPA: hypothetical protein VM074_02625 [Solimonas sp.]|nr:hypothetical protein [Solimonas sp.]
MERSLLGCLLIVPLAASAAAGDAARDQLLAARRERLQQKWEQQFRAADADHSRGLTLAEARAARLPDALVERFAEIDADASGELTPEELWATEKRRLDAQQPRHGPRS